MPTSPLKWCNADFLEASTIEYAQLMLMSNKWHVFRIYGVLMGLLLVGQTHGVSVA